jgi:hypothetical protein
MPCGGAHAICYPRFLIFRTSLARIRTPLPQLGLLRTSICHTPIHAMFLVNIRVHCDIGALVMFSCHPSSSSFVCLFNMWKPFYFTVQPNAVVFVFCQEEALLEDDRRSVQFYCERLTRSGCSCGVPVSCIIRGAFRILS